jgi:non-heme chloroperoxidase
MPTIVMIHGMWAGGWVWDAWRPVFESRGYRCIIPTLRFHDALPSSPPEALGSTSLLDYAQDLEVEIAGLDDQLVLMGHSMGGMLAQMLAERRSPAALVLLSPMPPQGINTLSPASLRMFRPVLKRWGFWRRPTRPLFADAVASMIGRMPEGAQKTLFDRLVHESGRAACEAGFWFVDPKRAKWINESRILCPILVANGTEDQLHTTSMMRRVARAYEPHSTFWLLPEHGHWLVGEPGWQDLAERIADWLDTTLCTPVQDRPTSLPSP